MQVIRLILICLALSMTGCDSARIADLESENAALKKAIQQHNQKIDFEMAKWEHAASTYNGCMSLVGIGSFLCPDSALIFGETAVTHGMAGAGGRYWLILACKLTFILGLIAFMTLAGWIFYVKRAMPDKLKIENALKLVSESESNIEKAKIEENKILAAIAEIKQEYIIIKNLTNETNDEYQEILRKKQEIEIMSKAMKSFD